MHDMDMYRHFNCGIGFVISAPKEQSHDIVTTLELAEHESAIIGKTRKGTGKIKIKSAFSDREVVL
jgi:phosphoribosylaminoimidazole (AIR) synthetase